jgi:hypothetical protein
VEEETAPRSSIIERHTQTIIVAILLALLLWAGATLLTIRDDVIAMKVQVAQMQSDLRNAGDDRFRGTDWRREREIIEQRFGRIEALLERHVEAANGRRLDR